MKGFHNIDKGCLFFISLSAVCLLNVCFDLNADCLSENERYKDSAPMKRLLMCRQEEVKAVYHEKELVEVLLTMSRKLQEHVVGRCVCVCIRSKVHTKLLRRSVFVRSQMGE